MMSNTHYFFILPNSPWPLLSSVNSFNLMFSMLLFLKFGMFNSLFLSILNICFCSFIWWSFYSGEINLEGMNSFSLESGLKISMMLFISSEVLFFFSFFWSYFHFFLSPSMEVGMIWPPLSIEVFDSLNVPLINTLILLTSGITVTISHHFLIKSNNKLFLIFSSLTFFLGFLFSILQLLEYRSSFFSLSDSVFGTSFFLLTGFHGVHVLIGTMFLLMVTFRSIKFVSSKKEFLSFELASWYWHFVDVVWIFLYFIIYYLNN